MIHNCQFDFKVIIWLRFLWEFLLEPILNDVLIPENMEEFTTVLDVRCRTGRSTVMIEDIYPEANILGRADHI